MNNQDAAVEKLKHLKCGAIFMEMGTGKTKVALDIINLKHTDYVLWICPFSLKDEIKSEVDKWYPGMEVDIVGCESIGSSDRVFINLFNKLEHSDSAFIVVDESLKIKNRKAKRTARIMELGRLAKYRFILNGTPVTKNCLDLWSQMQFLSPKILNMSYAQFKNNYTEYYINGKLKGFVKRQHNIDHLISLINPYIFDSALELERKKNYYSYEYRIKDRFGYEQIKQDFIYCNFDSDLNFYSLMTKLQMFYVRDNKELLEELLSNIKGRKIVFVKYLNSIPENEERITGETRERAAVIDRFRNGEFETLYMTYGCGAYGLNLQFCKNIIFAEHSFDYAQREQAEARIYRIGQQFDVNYYDLFCKCGLEDMIRASLNKKSNLLQEIKREIEKEGVDRWLKSI